MKKFLSFLVMTLTAALFGVDGEINIISSDGFKPIEMHGMTTGTFGWFVYDFARKKSFTEENRYVSGEDCFVFSCENNVATFTFKSPLNSIYTKNPNDIIEFGNRQSFPYPPAPSYHSTGRVKVTGGKLRLNNRGYFPVSQKWQSFDIVSKEPLKSVQMKPAANASFSFADFKCYPVYPSIGGEIALPDGGKLTRFLVPKNASYLTRWGISVWRGWLWKLTGTALPIEEVDTLKPTPGAFVALPTMKEYGYWDLTVNKEGIVLSYNHELSINPALMDYLRLKLNCNFYAVDLVKIPADGSIKALPAFDRKARPLYRQFTGNSNWNAMGGGVIMPMIYSHNDVNYYHLPNPQDDHVLNTVLPMEKYFEPHPEYFMLDTMGKRVINASPYLTNPCLSNPEVMQIMVDNSVKYAKAQVAASKLCVTTGDAPTNCTCPKCVAINGSPKNASDTLMDFTNHVAERLAKEKPEMNVEIHAYASRRHVPKNVQPKYKNIDLVYCLSQDIMPCTLHIDCELNQKCLQDIKEWYELAGRDSSRLSYETYRDIRPLIHLRRMDYLKQYGTGYLFMWQWKGFDPSIPFVTSRWLLGEDIDKLVEEFENAYYGAGGKYVHESTLLVEKFAQEYKHTPEELASGRHIGCWCGSIGNETVMTRELLDKVYALFDQAEKAVGTKDPRALYHIHEQRGRYLCEDLYAYRRYKCFTKPQMDRFVGVLKDLIRIARLHPTMYRGAIHYGIKPAQFIATVSGIAIKDPSKFWATSPEMEEFMAKGIEVLQSKSEKVPGGWYFSPFTMMGLGFPEFYDYECPRRACYGLHRTILATRNSVSAILELDKVPEREMYLAVEGLDDEKPGKSSFTLTLNGHKIFSGENTFEEHSWSRMGFVLKPEWLKVGKNTFVITNTTPNHPTRSLRYPAESEEAVHDSQWGWLIISELCIMDPNGDFKKFCANDKDSLWAKHIESSDSKPGVVEVKDGKAILTAEQGGNARLAFFKSHRTPKTIAVPGDKIVMKVTASGEGALTLTQALYQPYRVDKNTKSQIISETGYQHPFSFLYCKNSQPQLLSQENKTFTFEAVVPKNAGFFFPRVTLEGKGKAVISDIEIQIKRK